MKCVIVGAVAGGASTAARLRRMNEHAEIILFERGEYISYANCGLPYYIGNIIRDRNKLLVQTAARFHARFNVDVRVLTEVTAINPQEKTVTATNLSTGETYTESYDKLVLSPGAVPVRPSLPGLNLPGIFTLRNVADTDKIKAYVEGTKGSKAVVIGGGFVGLEMAENLHALGLEVALVEKDSQVLAPFDFSMAALVQQHLRANGVQLHLGAGVAGFRPNVNGLEVMLANGQVLPANVVILSIGVRPEAKLARDAGLQVGTTGGIRVNEYLQTSDPDIYAVGDAIEFPHPITGQPLNTLLAGPANKQGRICANNIALGNVQAYTGSINTAILGVFEMTAGTAGMAAKHLQAAGIPFLTSTTHSGAHASYYPGSRQMTVQLAFSPDSGRLLGAQVVGFQGVDKRVDLLAQVIKSGGTIYDLEAIEHAYAPPFSSAKDPVHMAAYTAENMLLGRMPSFYWQEVASIPANALLVDVRTEAEFANGHIAGSINIPLDNLRECLDDLESDRPVYIYCQGGQRGYLAVRILQQNGFERVVNLSGGYYLWKTCSQEVVQIHQPTALQVVP